MKPPDLRRFTTIESKKSTIKLIQCYKEIANEYGVPISLSASIGLLACIIRILDEKDTEKRVLNAFLTDLMKVFEDNNISSLYMYKEKKRK